MLRVVSAGRARDGGSQRGYEVTPLTRCRELYTERAISPVVPWFDFGDAAAPTRPTRWRGIAEQGKCKPTIIKHNID